MHAYSVEKVVSKNGAVHLEALPFPAGELVEVIVLSRKGRAHAQNLPKLKDSVSKYELPLEPVADEDWDVLK